MDSVLAKVDSFEGVIGTDCDICIKTVEESSDADRLKEQQDPSSLRYHLLVRLLFSVQSPFGRVNLIDAPFVYALSIHIFPPCASTMPLHMVNPKPVPPCFLARLVSAWWNF